MPTQIYDLNLRPGDSIFLNINGSKEDNIHVAVTQSGKCVIAAPQNSDMKYFTISDNHLWEIDKEERDAIFAGIGT